MVVTEEAQRPADLGSAPQPEISLERALARIEAEAETTLKEAAAATAALKRFRAAAHNGNLRDLGTALDTAEQAIATLQKSFAGARQSWDFDEEAYFGSGAFTRELLQEAAHLGLRIYEQDDRLYAYPALVRVLPNNRAVQIDKTRERRVRPSVLAAHLKDLQHRPARFRPDAFLMALFAAYSTVVDATAGRRRDELVGQGAVVRLLDIYSLLTLLPGQARDYSRQEFARDVYLLDQSGTRKTRRGHTVTFPSSTGTKVPASVIRVITQDGREKVYYGIAFHGGT